MVALKGDGAEGEVLGAAVRTASVYSDASESQGIDGDVDTERAFRWLRSLAALRRSGEARGERWTGGER
jgi:hypothetical protein